MVQNTPLKWQRETIRQINKTKKDEGDGTPCHKPIISKFPIQQQQEPNN